jgi:outer membrane protein, multidrug efflux system
MFKHSSTRLYVGLAGSALILSACGTAPQIQKFEPAVNKQFFSAVGTQGAQDPAVDFWRTFDDAQLNQLVEQALKSNADIRTAQVSLREVRATAGNAQAQLLPQLGLSGGARRSRERDFQGSDTAFTNNTFTSGFDAFWEVELFGRVAKDVKILNDANVAASEALLTASRVTIAAEVARNYLELRGLQAQRATAQKSVENLRASSKLITARKDAGRATALDTERMASLVASAEAALPAFDAGINRASLHLAVLTGATPGALSASLSAAKPLPGAKVMQLSNIGSPESLLMRRPDIKVAEQQAWAAAARVGIARSQLKPRLSLSGLLGLNSGRISDIGDSHTFVYNLGANIAWTFFDSGRRQTAIDAASARGDNALVNYERVVLAALEETEDALSTYNQMQLQTERLFVASQAADKAATLAKARLDAGVSDAVALLDAEREAIAARSRLAQSQTAVATSLIAVYKALAGGVSG